MEWAVLCSGCGTQPHPVTGRSFYLTSCGHFVCGGCKRERGAAACPECSAPYSVVKLGAAEQMPKDVAFYFTDPTTVLQKMLQAAEFQKSHMDSRLMLYHKYRLLLITKAAQERKKELEVEVTQLMQKAEHLKRHVAARRQLLEKVKAARRGETPMDVDPDSTTYPHRITTGTPSHPHRITKGTPSHPHHITKGTPSHPHCITKGTPSQPHHITKGTPSQPHPITKGTPSHPHPITAGTPSQPHPITKGTPSHPHPITAGTPSQSRGPYVPGVRLPSSIRPMSTGLQSRQRMAATPLERRAGGGGGGGKRVESAPPHRMVGLAVPRSQFQTPLSGGRGKAVPPPSSRVTYSVPRKMS